MIYEAKTEQDLEEISRRYELALQMRMIGPHQGLRLERIRSKQENILEYDTAESDGEEMDDKEIVSLDDSVELAAEEGHEEEESEEED